MSVSLWPRMIIASGYFCSLQAKKRSASSFLNIGSGVTHPKFLEAIGDLESRIGSGEKKLVRLTDTPVQYVAR